MGNRKFNIEICFFFDNYLIWFLIGLGYESNLLNILSFFSYKLVLKLYMYVIYWVLYLNVFYLFICCF